MKSLTYLYLNLIFFILITACKNNSETTSRVKTLPYYNEANFTPQWLGLNNKALKKMHQIKNFSLTNQNNKTITEATFKDKIYVTDFFFTSCSGICPKMTTNMKLVQDAFKDHTDVLLLSHSVTPKYDTPQILKKYAKEKGVIDGKWHLVTGQKDEIYNLGRNHYFVEEDLGIQKSNDEFLHTENFILVDKNRHIRGIYNGLNKTAIHQLIEDIKTLQLEK